MDSVRFANQLLIRCAIRYAGNFVQINMRLFPAAPPTVAGDTDVRAASNLGAARINLSARTREQQ
jgi:phage/plasmid primase-like uncharacterized protein